MEAGGEQTIEIEEARKALAAGDADALDIRDEEAWGEEHVPGATHIEAEKLSSELDELDSDRPLIVFAADADSGREALSTLKDKGFEASLVQGGMEEWSSEAYPRQPTDDPEQDE